MRKASGLSFLIVTVLIFRTVSQYQILLFDFALAFLDLAFLHVGSLQLLCAGKACRKILACICVNDVC